MSDTNSLDLTADDLSFDDDSAELKTAKKSKTKKTLAKAQDEEHDLEEKIIKPAGSDIKEPEKEEVLQPQDDVLETSHKDEEIVLKPEEDVVIEKPDEKIISAPVSQPSYSYANSEDNLEERIAEDLKVAFPGKGILEVTPSGFGFLRPKFTQSVDDIYVSQSQIRKFWLRVGDEVEGLIRPPKENEKFHGLLKIEKINGMEFTSEDSRKRPRFNDLTSMYPDKQMTLETESDVLSTRIMDLLCPIGFGQRALIVSPPKAGKTTILKNIAHAITTNFPKAHLMGILIGERPEEVTDIRRSMKAEVISSHFDQSPRDQIRAAEIGLARAKRLVEMGQDVIIMLDSVTRLARAYNLSVNSSGRTLSGGFDPAALYPAKKFLGAARNCEEGGSLTIIGTALINTESRMDDLIYEEFKGTGNMEVHLDRAYADKRIYPAIDVQKSSTRQEALIMDKEVLNKVTTLRRMLALLDDEERLTALIDKLSKTKNNADFLETLSVGK